LAIKLRASAKSRIENFYNLTPRPHCHKCGKHQWMAEATQLTWSCNACGNLIYYTYGALKQQIDLVFQSHRGDEYVYSPDKKTIVPVKNEELRRIKFRMSVEGC